MENYSSRTKVLEERPEPCIPPRVLKVVEIGDFWAKRTIPSIRLQGKWMLHAGILPDQHVMISNPEPGVLVIQVLNDFLTAQKSISNGLPKSIPSKVSRKEKE